MRTRAAVLAAAAELFADRGYPHTSIVDVADRVGVTPGAVYFHFRDKQDMAVEVVRELFLRWKAVTEQMDTEDYPPLETALALIDRLVSTFVEDPVVIAGTRLQAERSLIGTTLPPPYVGSIASMTAVLTSAYEAGELRTGVDPEAAARAIISAAFGVQHISGVRHQHTDLRERWIEARDLLFYAIAADPDALLLQPFDASGPSPRVRSKGRSTTQPPRRRHDPDPAGAAPERLQSPSKSGSRSVNR